MDWSMLLGGVPGGLLGFIAGIGQKFVEMAQRKQAHKMELERLEMAQKVDMQKAQAALDLLRERQAGQSFLEAVRAQASLRPASAWARDVLSLFRPAITVILVATAAIICPPETRTTLAVIFANMSTTAVGYWFGVRTFEKVDMFGSTKRR